MRAPPQRNRLLLPQVAAGDLPSFANRFLSLVWQRLPILLLICALATGPYLAIQDIPLWAAPPEDPDVIFDPPPFIYPLILAPRILPTLAFAWILVFAIALGFSTFPNPWTLARTTAVLTIRILACCIITIAATIFGLLGLGISFFFLLAFGLDDWLSLGVILLSLLPCGYVFWRAWPFPFVLMTERGISPSQRSWALTEGRTRAILLPVLVMAAFVGSGDVLTYLAGVHAAGVIWLHYLIAGVNVLLNWVLPISLALSLYARLQAAQPVSAESSAAGPTPTDLAGR